MKTQLKIPHCAAVLILMLALLCQFASPQTAYAYRIETSDQAQSYSAPLNLGWNNPFQATRLAAPLAAPAPDTASTNEDAPLDIDVLANDTGGPFTITGLITTSTQGSVAINPNQTIHYDPTIGLNYLAASQVVTDTFQYTAISGTVSTNTLVSVRVTGVNDNPTPVGDPAATSENTTINITAASVLANDSDPEGDTLSVTGVISSATKGSVSWNVSSQLIHYNPGTAFDYLAVGVTATDSFQYTVSDGQGGSASATVTVTLTGVNDNPTPAGDAASTGENTAIDIPASTLLANDTDPDTGDTLSVTGVITSGTLGIASWNALSQNVHYDPGTAFDYLAAGATANDTFQYTVSDGHGGSANATVTVTLTGVNDNPTPVSDTASTGENTAIDIPASTLLSNDRDPDGDPLSVTGVIASGTLGSASWNASSQTVHYDPGTAFNYLAVGATANDTFQYTVGDGQGGSANATVTVTLTGVNDNPTAVADTYNTDEDTVQNLNLLSNDTDPDISDTLTIQSLNIVGTLGTVTINPGGSSVQYDPVSAFNNLYVGQVAVDTFGYTISDGHGGTSSSTVSVSVTGVNDNPTPQNDTATTGENSAINISDSTVLSNDTDPDSDPLAVSGVVPSGTRGTVSWNAANHTINYDPGTAFDSLPYNGTGTDTFQYTVCDNHNGCANATVTVTINGVNDNPTPVNDTINTGENTPANISVLANDTDPDTGDSLTIQSINTAGTQGTVTINSGNTSVHYDPGTVFNHLGRSQTATDSFGYTVSDGHGGSALATVTVTIIGVNDPPTANNDTYTTPANQALAVAAPGILSNDSDPDTGDTLTPVLVINPSHGVLSLGPSGGFGYTPSLNYHGLDHFIYHASDGLASSPNVTVTIGVDVTNQPPVVLADTAITPEDTPVAIDVTSNDKDPDPSGGLNLSTLKVVISPTHGTTQVNTSTGKITYRPALNFNGTDTFHYQIYDLDSVLPLPGSAPVTVTVTPVNDPPQAADVSVSTQEDTSLPINVSGSVSDVDNNLDFSSLQVITPAGHGTTSIKPNLIIDYSPALNYNGPDLIGYRICDMGSLCAEAVISITVTPVNDPPVAANDHYYTKPISLTVSAPGVLANDYDVDAGDHLKVNVVRNPANGQLKLNEDGSFTYTPNSNFSFGNDPFRYQVYDSQSALSNTATVTITVDASPPDVNWQSPMGNGEIYYATSGQQVSLVITATDNIPIARVEFFWWDPKKGGTGGFVDIASVLHAPFRALIDVSALNIGWNQVFARAYDAAGNINNVGDPHHPGFIWIIRQEKIYLPLLSFSRSP